MDKKFTGPFFVKDGDKYNLAGMCEDRAFGDEHDCLLNPCVYFMYLENTTETEETDK